MPKIMLGEGYRNLRVGHAQLLRIKKASYDEKFMVAKLTFEDAEGRTQTEQYRLMGTKKGEMNQGALGALSTVAKCATKNHKNREIDPLSLKGLYVVADVVQQDERNEDGELTGRSFLHLRNIDEAEEEFSDSGDDAEETAADDAGDEDDDDFDLDDILA
ncbi:hypothetical protein VJ923_07145 [Adlercreutzia sp. R25]|uniref:hypothetical protein n=1 Tax=Adlercreutzia shanghongiae TaxID=3111773 RepID=UPI002DBE3F09|nr:hypothetical protein [Adlercreutzia sp. R25]MEC4272929.1 hypothetical protein [Adlercreutzia sp. R25]